ncbi:DUF1127 domain-containing protein [Frigidibacter sp. MR17.14]|uniref:DUF1127 domain-containing protein n=1 Tax=Frigidibacter sp. MR17.14 TaxID=3126509 RepID=UPI003012D7EE
MRPIHLPRTLPHGASRPHGLRLPRLSALLMRLSGLRALRRQRRALALLDPHLLRDVGLGPEQAAREAERPLWDAPAHWRR